MRFDRGMSNLVSPELAAWLEDAAPGRGPFSTERLTTGTSNQTFKLTDPNGSFLLQRPPTISRSQSAHDMARQFRILEALSDEAVPTPRTIGYCSDPSVLGAPFMVVEFVAGFSGNSPPPGPDPELTAREVGYAAVDALAAVANLDWRAVGLEGFGRPEGFLERQVGRWEKQYDASRIRDLPLFAELGRWLEDRRPDETDPAILHGDFHLANCLLIDSPIMRVTAIVDWEMATIGDPMLDLGELLLFWGPERPAEPSFADLQRFSRIEGSPTRGELAERYGAATGRSAEALDYYLVLSGWKLVAILEATYAQYRRGDGNPMGKRMERDIPSLLEELASIAGGVR